jgi:very-short-patch-repair endonuclease
MKKRLTKEDLINSIEDLKNKEYTILSDYKGRSAIVNGKKIHLKILVKHNKCGHIWKISADGFIGSSYKKGNRCPNCQHPNSKRSFEWIKSKIDKIGLGKYELISTKYTNGKEKLTFRHINKKCQNHVFKMVPKEFIYSDHRCPECNRLRNESKYDKFIKKFLKKYKIKFIQEKRFNKCTNIRKLSFDFYLPDYDLLIEYDGYTHKRAWFSNNERLQKTIKNDKIKNNFVKKHKKLKLIRISCKLEALADFLHEFFIEEDSTAIERYNITYIE